jgi:hypothetical protein
MRVAQRPPAAARSSRDRGLELVQFERKFGVCPESIGLQFQITNHVPNGWLAEVTLHQWQDGQVIRIDCHGKPFGVMSGWSKGIHVRQVTPTVVEFTLGKNDSPIMESTTSSSASAGGGTRDPSLDASSSNGDGNGSVGGRFKFRAEPGPASIQSTGPQAPRIWCEGGAPALPYPPPPRLPMPALPPSRSPPAMARGASLPGHHRPPPPSPSPPPPPPPSPSPPPPTPSPSPPPPRRVSAPEQRATPPVVAAFINSNGQLENVTVAMPLGAILGLVVASVIIVIACGCIWLRVTARRPNRTRGSASRRSCELSPGGVPSSTATSSDTGRQRRAYASVFAGGDENDDSSGDEAYSVE